MNIHLQAGEDCLRQRSAVRQLAASGRLLTCGSVPISVRVMSCGTWSAFLTSRSSGLGSRPAARRVLGCSSITSTRTCARPAIGSAAVRCHGCSASRTARSKARRSTSACCCVLAAFTPAPFDLLSAHARLRDHRRHRHRHRMESRHRQRPPFRPHTRTQRHARQPRNLTRETPALNLRSAGACCSVFQDDRQPLRIRKG